MSDAGGVDAGTQTNDSEGSPPHGEPSLLFGTHRPFALCRHGQRLTGSAKVPGE